MSRRGLFGLGLSRVGQSVEASLPSTPRTPGDVRARWDETYDAQAAARLWAPALTQLRAHAGDLPLVEAPPHDLPFADGELDGALSLFGPQRTPDGRRGIRELFRVVRPGATVGFAVWTSGSLVRLLRVATDIDPPATGVAGCWAWGRRERLRQDLDHVAGRVAYRRVVVEVSLPGDDPLGALAATVPALGAALSGPGPRRRLEAALEREVRREGETATLPAAVLLVAAPRR